MRASEPQPAENAAYDQIEQPASISFFIHVLNAYRGVILLSLIAIAVGYGIFAAAWYLRGPSQTVTSIPFRLEFKGAAEGRYPNGNKFSTNDIVNAPILLGVYEQSGIGQYLPFSTFARSVFIVENNREYERLQAEYQTRLNDVKLTPIDRERIEREFEAKRDALRKSDYALNYLVANGSSAIPDTVVRKALGDILREWSDYAAKTQHALLYDVPVLSPRFVDFPVIEPENHLTALLLLRMKVTQVRQNLQQISQLPGVQLVRTNDGASLEEVRLQLDDLIRYRIEPQLTLIRINGLIDDQATAVQFLESQLAHDERQLQAGERRVAAIRDALATYSSSSSGSPAAPPSADGGTGTADAVMPQISDTFLDRLVQLTNLGADQAYRQQQAEELRDASTAMIPIREAVEFDRQLLEAVRSGSPRDSQITSAEFSRAIERVRSQLRELITQMNKIHATVSRSLNPATNLYTVVEPPTTVTVRVVSLKRLAAFGILLLLISLPVIAFGCLIHNRVRQEEADLNSATTHYPTSETVASE